MCINMYIYIYIYMNTKITTTRHRSLLSSGERGAGIFPGLRMSAGPTTLFVCIAAAFYGFLNRTPTPLVVSQAPDPLLEEVRALRGDLLTLPASGGLGAQRPLPVPSCPSAPPCSVPNWHWVSFGWGVLGGFASLLGLRLCLSCIRLAQFVEAVQLPAPRIAGQTLRLT